jgi:hypothetical protein
VIGLMEDGVRSSGTMSDQAYLKVTSQRAGGSGS